MHPNGVSVYAALARLLAAMKSADAPFICPISVRDRGLGVSAPRVTLEV